MIIAPKTFENLDEAFRWINRGFLINPKQFVEFQRGAQSFCEDLVLKVKEPTTNINLHEYAFNPKTKWSHLIKSYIDPETYYSFWEGVRTVTGTSYQFRFRNRNGRNGPCLIALVLTRDKSEEPWKRAKVLWRTAELQRKFAADLVLIHNFFREIPEDCVDMVKLDHVTLYLAQAFQSWRLIGPLVENFCDWDEVDQSHDHGKKVFDNFEKVYKDPQPELKYAPVIRMQKYYKKRQQGELPDSHPNDLSLAAEVEKIIGRQ